eukprot:1160732-Pelagomonas_calceolata.AAC.3
MRGEVRRAVCGLASQLWVPGRAGADWYPFSPDWGSAWGVLGWVGGSGGSHPIWESLKDWGAAARGFLAGRKDAHKKDEEKIAINPQFSYFCKKKRRMHNGSPH